jgi:DNA-binding NarL/FixJ family response regulator
VPPSGASPHPPGARVSSPRLSGSGLDAAGDGGLAVAVVASGRLSERVVRRLELDGANVVAAVPTVDELADACGARTPHVTVVASGDDAEHLVRDVLQGMPRTRVVAIVSSRRSTAIRAALRAGADGVMQEAGLELRLSAVVRLVALGHATVPRERRLDLRRHGLSQRERDVVTLAARGLRNADIAAELSLASSTVKRHLSAAYAKVGVRSREELPAVLNEELQDDGAAAPADRPSVNGET